MVQKNNIFKNYIIVLAAISAFLVIGFLGYRYLAPFGKIVYYHFASKMPEDRKVSSSSQEKDSVLKILSQIITASQSKLQLKLISGDIESVKATLKFRPTVNEILIGARGKETDNFQYHPLYRDVLSQLNWPKITEDKITLWQKESKYGTVEDFLANPPFNKTTAFYFIDLSKVSKPKTPASQQSKTQTIDIPFRGSHTLLVRVDISPLVLKINKQDNNAYDGEDKLKIAVLSGDRKLVEKTIEDDGITDSSKLKSQAQKETITLNGISPGVYRIDLSYEGKGDDILIPKIEINQEKVIFRNHVLFLGDKPTTIWTNTKKVQAITAHKTSLQTVKLDDKYDLNIKEEGKLYSFDLESITGKTTGQEFYKLKLPKNDLTIIGGGYFSFSQDSFFLPEMINGIELDSLENLNNADYLLTSYQLPKKEGDWLIAEAEFNPIDLKTDGDKLYFSLEIPQIAEYGGELEIDYLEIVVKHKGILEKSSLSKPEQGVLSTPVQNTALFFSENLNKVKQLFVALYQKIFRRLPDTMGGAPHTITPTSTPTSTPTPTPPPINIKVSVLNGGAEKGAAGKFAEILKTNGFSNVITGNADKLDYKNAQIRYRPEDKNEAAKITEMLKNDYENIDQKEAATTSAEIIVTLGKK